MTEQNRPNPASDTHKREGDRDEERNRQDRTSGRGPEGEGGVTNRPLEEEKASQDSVPARGERQGNTHA